MAVLGIEIQAGIFEIMDIAYPDCAPQKPLPLGENKRGKIALVSGLNIGDEGHYDLKLELLKQYLLGELGNAEDKLDGSLISQLIIAGDSIMPIQNLRAEMDLKNFVTTNNYGSKNISKYNVESFKKLDEFLTDILVSLPVAVMPGKNDPAEICLPQQPLHRSLFQNNSSLLDGNRLTRLTNPQWIDAQTVKILGTSGQNVDDIKKYIVPKRITNLPQLKLWKTISSGKTLSLQHQILYIATRMKIMIHSFSLMIYHTCILLVTSNNLTTNSLNTMVLMLD